MSICLCKVRLRVQDEGSTRFRWDQYIQIRQGDYDAYDGDYTVTPMAETQILDTDHKIMTDDLTITAIPYTEVSNPSGGYTVSIG